MNEVERVVIAEKGKDHLIVGNLTRCPICKLNFTTIIEGKSDACVMCEMRLEKEKELGRRLTEKEMKKLFSWLD